MKHPSSILILLMFVVLFLGGLTGCASTGGAPSQQFLQSVLNAALPETFEGDFHLDHTNPYAQINRLDFTGLKKVGGVWVWSGMVYNGHSAATQTNVTLKPSEPRIHEAMPVPERP